MNMKKILSLVICCLVLTMGAASADQIQLTYKGVAKDYVVGVEYNGKKEKVYAGEFKIELEDDFMTYAYCVDLAHHIQKGLQTYHVKHLSDLYNGLEAAYLLHTHRDSADNVKKTALQLAIWELTHDDVNFYSGVSGNVKTYYEAYIAEVEEKADLIAGMADLLGNKFIFVTNDDSQDLIMEKPVPEPGTIALLGLGLIAAFAVRRKAVMAKNR